MRILEEAKQVLNDFLIAEADSYDKLTKIKDIDIVNEGYEKMHSYTVDALREQLGQIRLMEPKSDSFYKGSENYKDTLPRFLFKVSLYKHSKYEHVIVAYTSNKNPRPTANYLNNAFFLMKEGNDLKIGSYVGYTNLDPDLQSPVPEYKWAWLAGLPDLDFESLGELIQVDRILEPKETNNGLKMYLEDA